MTVRAMQSRVLCDRQALLQLWRTHCVFNERLPIVLAVLLRMRRGECGSTEELRHLYQAIGCFILARNSRDAWYLLNSVSKKNWKPDTARKMNALIYNDGGQAVSVSGESWADKAAELTTTGTLLYDKRQIFGGLPSTLEQMLCRNAVAIIGGHDALVRLWEQRHLEWRRRKLRWESDPDHKKYLALRPRFEEFEKQAGGRASKKRQRWHKYMQWLQNNPDLAAWRQEAGATPANTITSLTKVKAWRRGRSETEEFWKANPELQELDRLHGYYEKEFVRRGKRKRNSDGFEHRPTFTVPHAIRHPSWYVFSAPQSSQNGYRRLILPRAPGEVGSLELLLLTGDNSAGDYPREWVSLRFRSDPRLADFHRCTVEDVFRKGKRKGAAKEKEAYEFLDRQLQKFRAAQISGIKLIFKNIRLNADGSLLSAAPYLVFTCNIKDEKVSDTARAIRSRLWRTDSGTHHSSQSLPDGLIGCAVDFGIRHFGFATLADYRAGSPHVLRSRNIWLMEEEETGAHPGRWSAGPEVAHLVRHKRELQELRRLRGRPVYGEASHVELQSHITHMSEDRYKKGARAVINFALNVSGDKGKTGIPFPRADVLLIESLAGLLPDAERERGINRALLEFNRGHLVNRIIEMAQDVGLRIVTINPVGTSQVCSKCGSLGRRYSIRRSRQSGLPDIHFGTVEKLFACRCGYYSNADHNASVNLHRQFYLGEAAVASYKKFRSNEAQNGHILEVLESELLPQLRQIHNLQAAALESAVPFYKST